LPSNTFFKNVDGNLSFINWHWFRMLLQTIRLKLKDKEPLQQSTIIIQLGNLSFLLMKDSRSMLQSTQGLMFVLDFISKFLSCILILRFPFIINGHYSKNCFICSSYISNGDFSCGFNSQLYWHKQHSSDWNFTLAFRSVWSKKCWHHLHKLCEIHSSSRRKGCLSWLETW